MAYTDLDSAEQQALAVDAPPVRSANPYTFDDLNSLKTEVVAVTPAMARTMRDSMHFERQRPISARNVQRLDEEMQRGWFLAGTPIFLCELPDGRKVIVNGNHTLEAVSQSGVTVPLTVITKLVADIEEAARVYATFDIQKVRTWRDTLQATGFSQQVPMADHVVAALGLIMEGFSHDPHFISAQSRNARLELLPLYVEAAAVIASALENGTIQATRLIKRAGVLSVALYTARYQPSTAHDFWRGAALDDGLRSNDPRKALLRYLINNKATAATRTTLARAAALAWNAFFEGRTLEYVKPNQADATRILGTPWQKGRPQ